MVFSHHEACPRCQAKGQDLKGDNLGVWADGHKYCFKCNYYAQDKGNLNVSMLAQKLQSEKQEQEKDSSNAVSISLPSDYSINLPAEAVRWLDQYDITKQEMHRNRIGWSKSRDTLVFPVFASGELIFAQERFFSHPKMRYKTHGATEDTFHFMGPRTNNLVLVEDLVSAIKVSRQFQAMPLWGSSISQDRILRLARFFDHITVWLDNDKASYAIRRAAHMKPYFTKVSTVVTEYDPKAYTNEEIKEFLNEEVYEIKSGVC